MLESRIDCDRDVTNRQRKDIDDIRELMNDLFEPNQRLKLVLNTKPSKDVLDTETIDQLGALGYIR